MANSKVSTTATATGAGQKFAVPFSFISRTHVDVEVNGSSVSFTWNNDGEVVVTGTVTTGDTVLRVRSTSPALRLVDYVDGSNLSETDLDTDSLQAFYLAQEAIDELDLFSDSIIATSGHLLIGNGTDYINKVISGDITITSGGVVTIASDVIVDADINSAAAIAYSKLALTGAIVNADVAAGLDAVKIGNADVTNTKLSYLATTTSDVQTQIDGIVSGMVTDVLDSTFAIKDNGDGTKKIAFQASGITTGTTRTITMPDADVTLGTPSTEFSDAAFKVQDNNDATKEIAFQASGVTTGTVRTITMPDADVTLVAGAITISSTDTLTNKTIDADGTGNVITNIGSSEIKSEMITGQGTATLALTDKLLASDTDNSGALIEVDVQDVVDLAGGGITLSTEQSTGSGTSFNFSSIPAGTKEICVLFENVSTDSTDHILVQLGDSGGIEATGYVSTGAKAVDANATAGASSTTGFIIPLFGGGNIFSGIMTLKLKDSTNFTWVAGYSGKNDTSTGATGGGHKSLSAELTQVTITRSASASFDGGSINISYS